MKIIIKDSNFILADQVQFADTFMSRFKGWMGKTEIFEGEALVIEPCNSIHTFFMKLPIDVIFLNKKNEIVFYQEGMRPYKISSIISDAQKVIELRIGKIHESKLRYKDSIIFVEN
ncbi:DUF192 domain-containing protein [Paenibacillus whitsoniae]|uniref:DUF192 domain-containing protein n=1 Tax=Paenibacillus whitsoniae TaxID=2496558 RepID=A0A3S0BPF9_9BACL|nr:DUF192 domain-containing protein [Paenibacillus whitsoniae]RTE11207.1 DUF192 domain-containing protein [Paenibacillus whitsoniae]